MRYTYLPDGKEGKVEVVGVVMLCWVGWRWRGICEVKQEQTSSCLPSLASVRHLPHLASPQAGGSGVGMLGFGRRGRNHLGRAYLIAFGLPVYRSCIRCLCSGILRRTYLT